MEWRNKEVLAQNVTSAELDDRNFSEYRENHVVYPFKIKIICVLQQIGHANAKIWTERT